VPCRSCNAALLLKFGRQSLDLSGFLKDEASAGLHYANHLVPKSGQLSIKPRRVSLTVTHTRAAPINLIEATTGLSPGKQWRFAAMGSEKKEVLRTTAFILYM
jgi:hypothetical protein